MTFDGVGMDSFLEPHNSHGIVLFLTLSYNNNFNKIHFLPMHIIDVVNLDSN